MADAFVVGIIPARMGSSRFPGKPLAPIAGVPMVGHCLCRAAMSTTMNRVCVATCDDEIASYVRAMGGEAVMTSPAHERASDRAAEAIEHIEKTAGQRADIVVMIQGDEPMLRPEMIDEAIAPLLEDKGVEVVNLMAPIHTDDEHDDANEVKVVVGSDSNALYFSREAIPSRRKGVVAENRWKQVCIIPFRREFLATFNALPQTPLEIAESVDMMRVLEHGHQVRMVPTRFEVYSVDTEADRQKVERLLANDDLLPTYQARAAWPREGTSP